MTPDEVIELLEGQAAHWKKHAAYCEEHDHPSEAMVAANRAPRYEQAAATVRGMVEAAGRVRAMLDNTAYNLEHGHPLERRQIVRVLKDIEAIAPSALTTREG